MGKLHRRKREASARLTDRQVRLLDALKAATGVATAQRVREGVALVLAHYEGRDPRDGAPDFYVPPSSPQPEHQDDFDPNEDVP